MIILAIETSCDDTAIAIVEIKRGKFQLLSNVISSQIEVHKEYGGVYPTLAKREHENNLPLVLKKALKKAKNPKLEAIAVTVGPGLDPCLWTGINFAKKLAKEMNLPVIPVNHIEAHILANLFFKKVKFPALALVVSGGHTQLILAKKIGEYRILGETRDDAAGECLDKVAKILGLSYPGGPIIAKLAKAKSDIDLPRPMINTNDYDFSFSGLKTAVLYDFKKQKPKIRKSKEYIGSICGEVQQAVIDVLIKKTAKAERNHDVKTIIVGGGVSANKELRRQFKKKFDNVLFPPKGLSTDNAVMIAIAGYYNKDKKSKRYGVLRAKPNLRL